MALHSSSRPLHRVYNTNKVCLCAKCNCTSGRRVRLDLTMDGPALQATRLPPAEARALLGAVGLGPPPSPASTLGRPFQWSDPAGRPAAAAAAAGRCPAIGQRRCPPGGRRRSWDGGHAGRPRRRGHHRCSPMAQSSSSAALPLPLRGPPSPCRPTTGNLTDSSGR